MTTRRFLFAVAVVAMGLMLSQFSRAEPKKDPKALKGLPAPGFAMDTLDGKKVDLESEKGNVVLIDFWASWCGPCKASLPHIQKLSDDKELAAKGLKVFAVNCVTWKPENKEKAEAYVKSKNFTFTVPLDTENVASNSYYVRGIPTTLIIGRDGTVKNVFIGFGGEESAKKLDEAIEAALAEPGSGKTS